MDIKKKNLIENNKLCFICILMIEVYMLPSSFFFKESSAVITNEFLSMLCSGQFTSVVGCLIGIVASTLGYFLKKDDDLGHILILGGCGVAYSLTLLTSLNQSHLFVMAFPITLCVVLFRNNRTCIIGSVVCLVSNLLFAILYTLCTDRTGLRVVWTSFGLVVVTIIIALLIVRRMNMQDTEIMDEVVAGNKKTESLLEQVRSVSDRTKENLEKENIVMNSLQENISSSTESISQISQSINLTAESIQTQTEMNMSITDALDGISKQAKQMSEESIKTEENVQEGNNLVNELKSQAENSAEINEQTAQMTNDLQDTAETVKDIVSTILGISAQTNLLALNASIEAARAGEAGRGFSVVAEEIRTLSENTKVSATEISDTIDSLIEKVSVASKNMSLSVEVSNKQSDMILKTGQCFEVILQSMDSLTECIAQVTEAVNSCVKSNANVMDTISNLSATSEEVAASAENSLLLSENCTAEMEKARDLLNTILEIANETNKE